MLRSKTQSGDQTAIIVAKVFEIWHVWFPLTVAFVMSLVDGGWYTAVVAVVVACGVLIALGLRRRHPQDDLRIVNR